MAKLCCGGNFADGSYRYPVLDPKKISDLMKLKSPKPIKES